MNNSHNNKSLSQPTYNKSFYVLAGAGVGGVVGGLYYLYSLISGDEIVINDLEQQIEDLNSSITRKKDMGLSARSAIKIMSMVTRLTEEKVKRTMPDIDKIRRAAFDNNEEYARICYKFLNCKEEAFQESSSLILDRVGVTKEEFQNRLAKMEAVELEKKLYNIDKP